MTRALASQVFWRQMGTGLKFYGSNDFFFFVHTQNLYSISNNARALHGLPPFRTQIPSHIATLAVVFLVLSFIAS